MKKQNKPKTKPSKKQIASLLNAIRIENSGYITDDVYNHIQNTGNIATMKKLTTKQLEQSPSLKKLTQKLAKNIVLEAKAACTERMKHLQEEIEYDQSKFNKQVFIEQISQKLSKKDLKKMHELIGLRIYNR